MRRSEAFLREFESVYRRTRKLVALIPNERVEWRPYPGAFSLGDLARHIATTERWMWGETIHGRASRYAGCGPEHGATPAQILALFDALHKETVASIEALREDQWSGPCHPPGGATVTVARWLELMLEHEIHHRGQMYTTLGMLNVAVPSLFSLTEKSVRDAGARPNAEPVKLLLASQNLGKLGEMRQLVAGLPYVVAGPRDVGVFDAPEETGRTFRENAALKALHYSRLTGLLTVADDSGLSVDALGGGPGLFSSRFGGEGLDDAAQRRLLLEKLEGVEPSKRGARFTSAVAVARGGKLVFDVERSVEGCIATESRGSGGFGYDPVFLLPERGATFAELDPVTKDRLSHRGKAFAEVRIFLTALARQDARES